jgi:hypothetical protein
MLLAHYDLYSITSIQFLLMYIWLQSEVVLFFQLSPDIDLPLLLFTTSWMCNHVTSFANIDQQYMPGHSVPAARSITAASASFVVLGIENLSMQHH